MVTLNRRGFLAGMAAVGARWATGKAVAQEGPDAAPTPAPSQAHLFTTITYNARHLEGWGVPKEHEARLAAARPQFPLRLALELALYNPDVVTLPEAPDEAAVAELAGHLGMTYLRYAEGAPGAILTHCPIVESKDRPGLNGGECPECLRDRYFARTVLDTPVGRVILYSAHTTALNGTRRKEQIRAMAEVIRSDRTPGQSVILQGDLNHASQWPEYQEWVSIGLKDAFALKGTGVAATQGTVKPILRLDYIWLYGPIVEHLTECRVLFEGAFRTHPDDPATFTFSDHLPLMARFG
ncbi:MAG TPA: endonuclease/exonuclease/phosphatase family protein [Candidatus Hydrogenedentes bacterium]|nr:endonuclease/exonuclease/phosphatase family protein [Candidatus Hydrogenedentota bacterium]HPG70048.1 endonuclease/exonuclease/phosphatase family protein [Candidatus Hydrogenedentota bacterium]